MLNQKLQTELIIIAKDFIESSPEGFKEYELMKYLEQHHSTFQSLSDSSELSLFRKHFLIMNVLYGLQPVYARECQKTLHITATKIYLASESKQASKLVTDVYNADNKLREYYLNWTNFTDATQEAVADLLDSFWIRYYALDERYESLKLLGLEETSSKNDIKKRFQALAAKHHPDKGGDAETFIKIRAAYEVLKA